MKSVHMQAAIRRKKKHYIMSEPRVTAENVLNREFTADSPHEKWLTDFTKFKLQNGKKAYLEQFSEIAIREEIWYDSSGVRKMLHNEARNLPVKAYEKTYDAKAAALA